MSEPYTDAELAAELEDIADALAALSEAIEDLQAHVEARVDG